MTTVTTTSTTSTNGLLVTPEMIARAWARIDQQEADRLAAILQAERQPLHPRLKARLQERGLQFPLPEGPLTVIMFDDFIHTVAGGQIVCCDDPDCCCYGYEYAASLAETAAEKRKRRASRRKVLIECNYEQPAPGNLAPGDGEFRILR